jgi:hypothetical protein
MHMDLNSIKTTAADGDRLQLVDHYCLYSAYPPMFYSQKNRKNIDT